jgi:hypothetical protein
MAKAAVSRSIGSPAIGSIDNDRVPQLAFARQGNRHPMLASSERPKGIAMLTTGNANVA